MMRWIVGSSLKLRFVVVAGGIALMVFGVGSLRKTPVDVFPEFAQPRVEVQTSSLGLSAPEMESFRKALTSVMVTEAGRVTQ